MYVNNFNASSFTVLVMPGQDMAKRLKAIGKSMYMVNITDNVSTNLVKI